MINRSFFTIKANVGSNIQDTSSAMNTIIGRFVNDAYFDVLRRINWQQYNEDYSFTLSSQDQALPEDFGKPLSAWDATNIFQLKKVNIQSEIKDNLSLVGSTGNVERYAIFNRAVRQQPPSASTLDIVSSSAGDTTEKVHVKGISSDVAISEDVTLTGTTPATTTNSYSRIISISKDADTTGKVTITDSSANVISILSPATRDGRVKIFRAYPAPAQTITINLPYVISALPMSDDNDMPVVDCADIIELGATSLAWMYKRQNAKAKDIKALFEQALVNLIWDQENVPDDEHLLGIRTYDRTV